jgi:integrase
MAKRPVGKRLVDSSGSVTVRSKASNGEGTLYPDQGGWRASWVDRNGKRRYVRGRTRELAERRRSAAIAEDAAASSSPKRFGRGTTVGELANHWLDHVAAHRVRPSSLGKYRSRVARFGNLDGLRVADVRVEQVEAWQSQLLASGLSAGTVADTRLTLHQVIAEAVALDLIAINPVDRVKPPTIRRRGRRALTVDETRKLLNVVVTDRLGGAVALLFLQGWRVSEVLGLAWSDLDLERGVAVVRRAAVYIDGVGVALGPTKTDGASGSHRLHPQVVGLLRARRVAQAAERLAAGPRWETHVYEAARVELVFTTVTGGLLNRQAVTKALHRLAKDAGIDPEGLATHTGRRTLITALYGTAGIDLADIARHVGHRSQATTADYVRDLGDRPERTAQAVIGLFGEQRH